MKSRVIDVDVTGMHNDSKTIYLDIIVENIFYTFSFKKFKFERKIEVKNIEACAKMYESIHSVGIPRDFNTGEYVEVNGRDIMDVTENILRKKGAI